MFKFILTIVLISIMGCSRYIYPVQIKYATLVCIEQGGVREFEVRPTPFNTVTIYGTCVSGLRFHVKQNPYNHKVKPKIQSPPNKKSS